MSCEKFKGHRTFSIIIVKSFFSYKTMMSQNGGLIHKFLKLSHICATIELFIKACHKVNKKKHLNEENM